MNLWMKRGPREVLASLLSGGSAEIGPLPAFDPHASSSPRDSDCILLFANRQPTRIEWPVAIVCDRHQHRDLLSWLWTHFPHSRPFTANIRLLAPEDIRSNDDRPMEVEPQLSVFFVALVLAEARRGINQGGTSLADAFGTFAFVASRAIALGRSPDGALLSSWILANELVGARTPVASLQRGQILLPWLALQSSRGRGKAGDTSELATSERRVLAAAVEVSSRSGFGPITDSLLSSEAIETARVRIDAGAPREQRVRFVDAMLKQLAETTTGDNSAISFVAGYMANQVSPGSLEHWGLLEPFQARLPMCLSWYAFCAAASVSSQLDGRQGWDPGSFGRRLLRECLATDDIASGPTCDIALAELEVANRGPRPMRPEDVQGVYQELLRIELSPGVETLLRPRWVQAEAARNQQKSLWPEGHSISPRQSEVLLGEISELSEAVEMLGRRVAALVRESRHESVQSDVAASNRNRHFDSGDRERAIGRRQGKAFREPMPRGKP